MPFKLGNTYLSPQERKQESRKVQVLLREWNKLKIGTDGVLYRVSNNVNQAVLPEHLRKTVYKELHEEMGHLGSERVIDLACERFFWPRMRQDITHYVTKVCPCLKSKKPPINPREPLHPIVTTAPFQMVAIDYLHLETYAGGYQYILVVMDHFTTRKRMRPVINQQKPLQISSTTTLFRDMASHRRYTSTKALNSRINCFTTWKS